MIPIEKNVAVTDEQGNEYEATYPKRAKGLVKNGRARFISENRICLACPPDMNLEDKTMSDNNTKATEKAASGKSEKLTADYCVEMIEKIACQTEYLNNVIAELGKMTSAGPGDIAGEEKAKALGTVVSSREETNRRLIDFYQQAYDRLTATDRDIKILTLRALEKSGENAPERLSDILGAVEHMC